MENRKNQIARRKASRKAKERNLLIFLGVCGVVMMLCLYQMFYWAVAESADVVSAEEMMMHQVPWLIAGLFASAPIFVAFLKGTI